MDVKEMNVVVETTVMSTTITTATKTTTMAKPTIIITQTASKDNLKLLELVEYCRMAQSTLKECETKIQTLISAKNESTRLKMEYLTRDKINITNSESLLQAKNELFQYKCELKSNYVAIEKAANAKKLQYRKLISSYEGDWEKALEEYMSNPLVKELYDIQRINSALEKTIETQEKLNASTAIQMPELHRNINEKFLNKIVEFAKSMIKHQKFLISQKINRGKNVAEYFRKPQDRLKFFKSVVPPFGKVVSFDKEDTSCFPGIDVSIFDEIMVPTENLEFQNEEEEEELFRFIQNEHVQLYDDNRHPEDGPEMFLNYYHQDQEKNKTQINIEGTVKQTAGKVSMEEDESQYFRTLAPECSKQHPVQNTTDKNWGHVDENLNEYGNKEFNENSQPSTGKGNNMKMNCEDNIETGKQIESEKSLSEASYDNQNSYPRENFEDNYNKTHSVTSEEMQLSAENESFGSPRKVLNTEQANIFKLQGDQEKEESKSFGDFFAIGGDKNSAKPSIFKLF